MNLRQAWSKDWQLSARLGWQRFKFEQVSGTSVRNLEGSTWNGSLGAERSFGPRFSAGPELSFAENFIVATDSSGTGAEVLKIARPALSANAKWKAYQHEGKEISLSPRVGYALKGKSDSVTTKPHLSYGLRVEATKAAAKGLSATGVSLHYDLEKFDSSQGKTTNAALKLQVNFSFDF